MGGFILLARGRGPAAPLTNPQPGARYPRRMTLPPDPLEPARPDLEAYRTAHLADPELAAAYEAENEAVRLDGDSIGLAWALGLIPLMLVLLLLSAALGEWVWDALPALFVAGAAAVFLVRLGWFRRLASDLPIHLPGHGIVSGRRKRRLLLMAGALAVGLYLDQLLGLFGRLQRAVLDWLLAL
jgi:hypothetical protein